MVQKRNVEEYLQNFVLEIYPLMNSIGIDEPLQKYIDSLGILEIIISLEDVYDIEIEETDLEYNNIKNIRSISRIVIGKLNVVRLAA